MKKNEEKNKKKKIKEISENNGQLCFRPLPQVEHTSRPDQKVCVNNWQYFHVLLYISVARLHRWLIAKIVQTQNIFNIHQLPIKITCHTDMRNVKKLLRAVFEANIFLRIRCIKIHSEGMWIPMHFLKHQNSLQ